MVTTQQPSVYVALVHHPVINKNGEVIGSAVTNLDIHDIARASKTFGVENYYIITPYKDQQELVEEITDHWKIGYGSQHNPARREALNIVRTVASIDEMMSELSEHHGVKPLVLATSASKADKTVSYKGCRELIQEEKQSIVLLFGTAHGLAPEIMESVDFCLPPITGAGKYNHLSVRSAVSIILDRLFGNRE